MIGVDVLITRASEIIINVLVNYVPKYLTSPNEK
jgi:hypothetical protein